MTTSLHATRELWMENAISELRPRFVEIGRPLPDKIHVSVGFGYGAKRENKVILGQCWSRIASEDGANHIFISPEVNDTARVLDILLHELIHATDDNQSGHRGAFAEAATRLGLEGPMTATTASVDLAASFMCLAATLGHYPHGALNAKLADVGQDPTPVPGKPKVHSGPRAQTNRYVRVQCAHCGYSVRTTRSWLARGNPRCPDGYEMGV